MYVPQCMNIMHTYTRTYKHAHVHVHTQMHTYKGQSHLISLFRILLSNRYIQTRTHKYTHTKADLTVSYTLIQLFAWFKHNSQHPRTVEIVQVSWMYAWRYDMCWIISLGLTQFMLSFTLSLSHSFTLPFTHSLTLSFTHSLIHLRCCQNFSSSMS